MLRSGNNGQRSSEKNKNKKRWVFCEEEEEEEDKDEEDELVFLGCIVRVLEILTSSHCSRSFQTAGMKQCLV